MGTTRTIVVQGEGLRSEALANAILSPGHLVELMSTGKVRKHATAGGHAETAFAVENDLKGDSVSDDYAANDLAQYNVFQKGEQIMARIADGEDIAIGDKLESNGDGTLRKFVPVGDSGAGDGNSIVAVAMEACDMSGSSGADPATNLCQVRIA